MGEGDSESFDCDFSEFSESVYEVKDEFKFDALEEFLVDFGFMTENQLKNLKIVNTIEEKKVY